MGGESNPMWDANVGKLPIILTGVGLMVCVYLGNTTELLPDPSGNSTQHFPLQYLTVWVVELQSNLRKDFTITEKRRPLLLLFLVESLKAPTSRLVVDS